MLGYEHRIRGADLLPASRCKGSRIARSVETSNAESPTPNVYRYCQNHDSRRQATGYNYGCHRNIPTGVPVALFLTNRVEFARFLHRQNQSVHSNAFMYIRPTPTSPHKRAGYGIGRFCKNSDLFSQPTIYHTKIFSATKQ